MSNDSRHKVVIGVVEQPISPPRSAMEVVELASIGSVLGIQIDSYDDLLKVLAARNSLVLQQEGRWIESIASNYDGLTPEESRAKTKADMGLWSEVKMPVTVRYYLKVKELADGMKSKVIGEKK